MFSFLSLGECVSFSRCFTLCGSAPVLQSRGYEAHVHGSSADGIHSELSSRTEELRVLGDEGEKRSAGGTLSGPEMKMGLCWMLIILLGCRLSQATPSKCTCDDETVIYFVPENGSIHVRVPCPNVTGEELMFFLHKDQEVIYNHTYREEISHGRLDVKLDKDGENRTVGFILTQATTESQGSYNCKATKRYPPPYLEKRGQGILLLDERFRFQPGNTPTEGPAVEEIQSFPWIWITAVALLSTYSLVVTVLALVSWMKLKKTDCQSDYMNTKPRAPRGNKKKRGVQNPIPRYF
uniref:T-cell-specific surface glycoprotein CD28-like n=1 Tax=Acanthochromis polyacanthus TaxID=80966 RepID=A0A3Q1F5S6_9TELE